MKATFIAFFTIVVSTHCSFSQESDYKNDSAILRNLEYKWLMAEFRIDTSTISKMMEDSFISVGDNSIFNKQQELIGIYRNMSERAKNNHVVDSLQLNNVEIRIYGTTAIVTYISATNGRINNVPFTNRRTRMYDVWIKRNNQWKAISSQVTPLR